MLNKWLLGWKAEGSGRRDGRNAIPMADDATPPPYLLFLREKGQERLRRLAVKWTHKDEKLLPLWRKRRIQYSHAQGALAGAEQAAAAAVARRDASPKAKNVRSLASARRALERARAKLNRAHERLTDAQAKRQARWNIYQARLSALTGEMDAHMQRYITANVGAREDGRTPLGLLDAHRPRLVIPEALQQLHWEGDDEA